METRKTVIKSELSTLPGGEIILQAAQDLECGIRMSTSLLLLSLYTTRLERLGYHLPPEYSFHKDSKIKLYHLLAQSNSDPFSTFKALEQRLLKLLSYLERYELKFA